MVAALDKDYLILEISFGRFEENDIVRIEDDYHKEAKPKTKVAAA